VTGSVGSDIDEIIAQGRVKASGFLVRGKCNREKLERAKGFEPSAQKSEPFQPQYNPHSSQSDYTQIRAQILDALGLELSQVVAAWPSLSEPLKAAILAIIHSAGGKR
jgi:hypothetical protein